MQISKICPNNYLVIFNNNPYRIVLEGEDVAILSEVLLSYCKVDGKVRVNHLWGHTLWDTIKGDVDTFIKYILHLDSRGSLPHKVEYELTLVKSFFAMKEVSP
jgi:hypothetical protein